MDIRFSGSNSTNAPENGLAIIKNDKKSTYDSLIFAACKFKPTNTTTSIDCQLSNIKFRDCRFKGINRFDRVRGTELRYIGCTFENYWETDFEHDDDKYAIGQTFKDQRVQGTPKPNKDFEGIEFLDGDRQPMPPPPGITVERGEKQEVYYAVSFVACIFDEKNPTILKNCALENVTY